MEIKPPNTFVNDYGVTIFLAGSIEQGKADDWQSVVSEQLQNFGFAVLNPRRDSWDSSWEQDISNLEFYRQVSWELDAIKYADHVLVYFQPGTLSPISLLELGILTENPSKVTVVCPEGFWRRGNVQIVCERFGIPVYDSLDTFIKILGMIYDE